MIVLEGIVKVPPVWVKEFTKAVRPIIARDLISAIRSLHIRENLLNFDTCIQGAVLLGKELGFRGLPYITTDRKLMQTVNRVNEIQLTDFKKTGIPYTLPKRYSPSRAVYYNEFGGDADGQYDGDVMTVFRKYRVYPEKRADIDSNWLRMVSEKTSQDFSRIIKKTVDALVEKAVVTFQHEAIHHIQQRVLPDDLEYVDPQKDREGYYGSEEEYHPQIVSSAGEYVQVYGELSSSAFIEYVSWSEFFKAVKKRKGEKKYRNAVALLWKYLTEVMKLKPR